MLKTSKPRYTTDELNARLRFVVGLVLVGCLAFSLAAMLFGLLFVYQGALSSVDAEFFKLLSPVVMFLTGTLSGVMIASGGRADRDGDGIPDDMEGTKGSATSTQSPPQPARWSRLANRGARSTCTWSATAPCTWAALTSPRATAC